jgi:hypothetical protein
MKKELDSILKLAQPEPVIASPEQNVDAQAEIIVDQAEDSVASIIS